MYKDVDDKDVCDMYVYIYKHCIYVYVYVCIYVCLYICMYV